MDLNDPDLTISGHGHVDGYIPNMSSGQGELHSITELSIIANFLSEFHSFDGSIKAVCDNQAVINKCHSLSTHNLQRHHDPNFDVYIMQNHYRKASGMSLDWVKGHVEKFPRETPTDLILQKLSQDEIYNIWCDRLAQQAWDKGGSSIPDPDVSPISIHT